MKKIVGLVWSVVLVCLMVSCGNTANTSNMDGTFVYPLASDPETLNPLFANVKEAKLVTNVLYSPLYKKQGDSMTYYLAESVLVSGGGRVMTVKLKDRLKWHDGQAITADDVIYTLGIILDEKQHAIDRPNFIIEGHAVKIEKLDDLTFIVRLPTRNVPFETFLGDLMPIPKHIYEKEEEIAKSAFNSKPIGSGPFTFKEWKKGESLLLEKNSDYFGGVPHLEQVAFRIMPDVAAQDAALKNNEITALMASKEVFDKYKDNDKFVTEIYDDNRLNYIVYNLNSEKVQDKFVRESISYALDRLAMITALYGDSAIGIPAYSLLTPGAEFHTNDVMKFETDRAKAMHVLQEGTILRLAYNTGRFEHKTIALVAQQQLKEVGVTVELVPYESKTFFNKLFSKNTEFDMAVNSYSWGYEPDLFRGMYETGRYHNATGYSNDEVDELWEDGAEETDAVQRKEMYIKLQQLVAADVPTYPIDYQQGLFVVSSKVSGMEEAKLKPVILFEDWSKIMLKK